MKNIVILNERSKELKTKLDKKYHINVPVR